MFLLLFLVLVLIAVFFIVVLPRLVKDDEDILAISAYQNNQRSKQDMFIEDYKWCIDNLTLRHSNILEEHSDELRSVGDEWDYYFPYKLSRYPNLYGFDEIRTSQKVGNGFGYECNNVEPFIYEFHAKVEALRGRMNPEDIKLYKKYGINYNFLLTDTK
ncbi:hypothetical protein TaPaz_152 [Acinetobacter phage TaPaz]|nr:hypothetical protein TaPaz_152 [Acinetobacter phage TaPaz]